MLKSNEYIVVVKYQTGHCECHNSKLYITSEQCFDEIARQALKRHERAHDIELRNNEGAIRIWTLAHKNNPPQLTRDNYMSPEWVWYEKEIPNGELKKATFKEDLCQAITF